MAFQHFVYCLCLYIFHNHGIVSYARHFQSPDITAVFSFGSLYDVKICTRRNVAVVCAVCARSNVYIWYMA